MDLLVPVLKFASIINVWQAHWDGSGELEAGLPIGIGSASIRAADTVLEGEPDTRPDGVPRYGGARCAAGWDLQQSVAGFRRRSNSSSVSNQIRIR